MRTTLLFLVLLALAGCAHSPSPGGGGVPVVQVMAGETSSEFNVLMPAASAPRFTAISARGENFAPTQSKRECPSGAEYAIHHVQFERLPAGDGPFHLVVEEDGKLRDRRGFELFPPQGESLRFAAVRWDGDARRDKTNWHALARSRPEWLFLFEVLPTAQGGEQVWWEAQTVARRADPSAYATQLVPTTSVWAGDTPLTESGTSAFRAFHRPVFPSETYSMGPGLAARIALRGMHFTLLEARAREDEYWGEAQEAWLLDDLKQAQLPTWIVSGEQVFGGYHGTDSFEGARPDAFAGLVGRLKEVPTPFVFLTTDGTSHEVMQFPRSLMGQLSFEFSVGPLRDTRQDGAPPANPWRVVADGKGGAHLWLETSLAENRWDVKVEARRGDVPAFARELSLTTEALKDFTIEKRQKRRRYRRARWRR